MEMARVGNHLVTACPYCDKLISIEVGHYDLEALLRRMMAHRIASPVCEDAYDHRDKESLHQPQDSQSGVSAVIGKWPGDETDEEIQSGIDDI